MNALNGQDRISIIIPLHRDNPNFRRCLASCCALDDENYEVIVVSDRSVDVHESVRVVLTGSSEDTPPGIKRDRGMEVATGDLLAFLDDDAFPANDWLQCIRTAFQDLSVSAVGGPGLTPPGSRWRERVSGAFYESRLGSGSHIYRFRRALRRDVDDFPAYNFSVRADIAKEVGGWSTAFYGGEDTAFCLALKRQGHRIIYDPRVIVYHFRRPILRSHWRQVGNVGRHRGYFVKAYPETSRRFIYFLPTSGVLVLVVLVAAAVSFPPARIALVAGIALYAITGWVVAFLERHELSVSLVLPLVAASTHFVYGYQFLRGTITKTLER